jgi:hypothetical protein
MTRFQKLCTRDVALQRLAEAGWEPRDHEVGYDDYEALGRTGKNGKHGTLLVDFAMGRFILDSKGDMARLLTHSDDAEGDPDYDAVLHALYEGEVVA